MPTAKEWRYIRAYVERHQLRPQLSLVALGRYVFTDRKGEYVAVTLGAMREEYEAEQAQKKGKKK